MQQHPEIPRETDESGAESLDWNPDNLWDSRHPPALGQVMFELGVTLAIGLALAVAAHVLLAFINA